MYIEKKKKNFEGWEKTVQWRRGWMGFEVSDLQKQELVYVDTSCQFY